MEDGVDGLLRDKTRPPGKTPLAPEPVAKIVELTHTSPTHAATHWTLRAMAKAVGVAASTVWAVWQAHGLMPHRWRPFTLSNDPAFVEKLTDIVGLYVAPPAHAVVLSIDDRSHSQARDRTQPGLPLKKGRGATMTHDYKRNGTTTLFAALTVLDGTVIGQHASRHRHQAFPRCLNRIARTIPAGVPVHAILDNDATHKHKDVQVWLARHPRWTFHVTPPHLERVAERARRRLRQADTTPSQIRRLPLRTRTPGRHPLRHRRTQHHRSQALRLDRRSRYHHRRKKKRRPNVGINLLVRQRSVHEYRPGQTVIGKMRRSPMSLDLS